MLNNRNIMKITQKKNMRIIYRYTERYTNNNSCKCFSIFRDVLSKACSNNNIILKKILHKISNSGI